MNPEDAKEFYDGSDDTRFRFEYLHDYEYVSEPETGKMVRSNTDPETQVVIIWYYEGEQFGVLTVLEGHVELESAEMAATKDKLILAVKQYREENGP